jgi:hypothetical protein
VKKLKDYVRNQLDYQFLNAVRSKALEACGAKGDAQTDLLKLESLAEILRQDGHWVKICENFIKVDFKLLNTILTFLALSLFSPVRMCMCVNDVRDCV